MAFLQLTQRFAECAQPMLTVCEGFFDEGIRYKTVTVFIGGSYGTPDKSIGLTDLQARAKTPVTTRTRYRHTDAGALGVLV